MNIAFYGTLRDPEVLYHVLGSPTLDPYFVKSVTVPGWACLRIEGEAYPLLRSDPKAFTTFDLYHDCPEDTWRRLVDYEGDEYFPSQVTIEGRSYQLFLAHSHVRPSSEIWTLETFQLRDKTRYLRKLS